MEQIANSPGARRKSSEIKELLLSFEKGNLSVIDFCKQHGISKGAFHQWRVRYGKSLAGGEAGFARLQVSASASDQGVGLFAEVKGIRIYQPVSAAYLKELLG